MNDLKFTTAGEYMDQVLLRLKQQAGIQDNPDQEGLDIFAQLIVEECAQLVDDRVDPTNAWITGDSIKQHFRIGEDRG